MGLFIFDNENIILKFAFLLLGIIDSCYRRINIISYKMKPSILYKNVNDYIASDFKMS